VASLCFEGPIEKLNLTEYTQPALLVTSVAAFQVLDAAGIQPAAVAGHSLGEYSAIVAAQGLSVEDALTLVKKRGRYMAEAVVSGSGLVVAVLGLSSQKILAICKEAERIGVVAPANFNCPGQVVVAGEKAAVERAIELAKQQGARRVMPLAVSVPVHTPLMQSAADRLKNDIDSANWSDLKVPLINNAESQSFVRSSDVRSSLIRQLASPVLWEQSIQTMSGMGVSTFIEVGPGKVLTGLVKRILPSASIFNVHDKKSLDFTLSSLSG
jgi:[acyl-carrier-protein] S-malonyltransferase